MLSVLSKIHPLRNVILGCQRQPASCSLLIKASFGDCNDPACPPPPCAPCPPCEPPRCCVPPPCPLRPRTIRFCDSPEEAVRNICDGTTLLIGGFGTHGVPENLLRALRSAKVKELTVVSDNTGMADYGAGILLIERQVKRIIASYIGGNPVFEHQFICGELMVEITPQGTLAERIRAGGSGIPAFYTPTGYGTLMHRGGDPVKYDCNGCPVICSDPKECREFCGREYILEKAITGDFALVKAWKADMAGNLVFREADRNFNPAMCKAAKMTIVEVEEIVETGEIDPEDVHVPHIYVDLIVRGCKYEKKPQEHYRWNDCELDVQSRASKDPCVDKVKEKMIKRAAKEFTEGMYVNLGTGIPKMAVNYLDPCVPVTIHSAKGVLGMGPNPKPSCDPSCPDPVSTDSTATVVPGASFFNSEEAFNMVRGELVDSFPEAALFVTGVLATKSRAKITTTSDAISTYAIRNFVFAASMDHLDLTVLGAMQVSRYGDIANWKAPGKKVAGVGGAMDLTAACRTKVVVVMLHTSKDCKPNILEECCLPVTGVRCVDVLITEKGVFRICPQRGMTLVELAKGETLCSVREATGCEFEVCPDIQDSKPECARETTSDYLYWGP